MKKHIAVAVLSLACVGARATSIHDPSIDLGALGTMGTSLDVPLTSLNGVALSGQELLAVLPFANFKEIQLSGSPLTVTLNSQTANPSSGSLGLLSPNYFLDDNGTFGSHNPPHTVTASGFSVSMTEDWSEFGRDGAFANSPNPVFLMA